MFVWAVKTVIWPRGRRFKGVFAGMCCFTLLGDVVAMDGGHHPLDR